MSTKKLNVCFVGCGGIAAKYWSVYRDLEFVRVVSCVSGSIESARRGAAELPDAIATTDFSVALAPDVDAVILNTPNALHRDQAIAAIEAGKHVLLQKPVAANVPDAEAAATAAEKSSRTIGLYMSYFDQPLVHDVLDMADRGWFGDIVHFYARLMHRGGIEWSQDASAGKPELAQFAGGDRRRMLSHARRAFHSHISMDQPLENHERPRIRPQSPLSGCCRRGSGMRGDATRIGSDDYARHGVVRGK
jgi:predicted dehydrogenase